ncbi:DUF1488 family protein (plasmid) [Novosphingobium sp. BL-8A]|uniref:DUF1488 family protein n=1 Tax=Novosphingobium sp. BL-8A TaxID=3127639 RepID=UPI0037570181
MPNLTFTSAVRTWLQDRRAVEFPGQWEATQYKFYVAGEVLEDLGGLEDGVNPDSALRVFDDHQGVLLPAADFLWAHSDKMQDEYVITREFFRKFQRDHTAS